MKRNCSLDEISDGKLYAVNDLVMANCNGCKGEATCCHGMGKSIILDPFDSYELAKNLEKTFEELLSGHIELNVVDGIILPNLLMVGISESCTFLNEKGRCRIHSFRPGICRIFPLGRFYENHGFKYFLQINECMNQSITKTKVSKWIDTSRYEEYEQFLIEWHYFLNDVEGIVKSSLDDKLIKNLNMYILNCFYIKKYDGSEDFYEQFNYRMKEARNLLNITG